MFSIVTHTSQLATTGAHLGRLGTLQKTRSVAHVNNIKIRQFLRRAELELEEHTKEEKDQQKKS